MSFQVDNVKSVHVIGAVFAFIVGGVYFYIQAYISWYAKDIPGSSKLVRMAQLIICALYAVFAIIGSKIAFMLDLYYLLIQFYSGCFHTATHYSKTVYINFDFQS